MATFKKKRPYQGMRKKPTNKMWTHDIEKKSSQTPGPWRYSSSVDNSWITGPKAKSIEPYLRDETRD
jgi:hypothetical protein